jgi:hypothetical protein
MKFLILGDVHGNLRRCDDMCRKNRDRTVIQIGDLGVGFEPFELFKKLPKNFRFFPGNHDNRQEAKKLSSCLGDYGEFGNLFFLSGADSIDKNLRIPGRDWWPDEELTYEQGQKAIEMWANSKAEVLLSHDLPQSLAEAYYLIYDRSITRTILQQMTDARKPKLHIFGHHHKSKQVVLNGIQYVGLAIDEGYKLDLHEIVNSQPGVIRPTSEDIQKFA